MSDVERVKARLFRYVQSSVRQTTAIVDDLSVDTMELAHVRAAAKQAEQTAAELNKLIGILEVEFINK